MRVDGIEGVAERFGYQANGRVLGCSWFGWFRTHVRGDAFFLGLVSHNSPLSPPYSWRFFPPPPPHPNRNPRHTIFMK